jgi:hypothetical protein
MFSSPRHCPIGSILAWVALLLSNVSAQEIRPTMGIALPVLGKIAPRFAKEITSKWWSIGGETLDRDFASYKDYKRYLGPLGAKGIRLQTGWAKCEKKPGVYDWAWLDTIIDDAVSQGLRPWLELSYGNKIYPGGGDTGLGGGFPSSAEALTAWDNWVRALVARYKNRVTEWEVWNEPDLNSAGTAPASAYVDLYLRTASIIRELQPQSRVWALALAHKTEYADEFLAGMKAKGKLDLIDAITFHGYPRNPDDTTLVDRLRAVTAKHGRTIELRQGETGAPSRYQENFALAKIQWSETTQAKWDLRRLLAHRAKDVPMNLFTISDMHYTQPNGSQADSDGVLRMNYKGLLGTNPDKTISHVKAVYPAAQSVFTIFDDAVKRIDRYASTTTATRSVALSGYQNAKGAQIVALWFNDAMPVDDNTTASADVTLAAGKFNEPVLIDVRTSTVYSLPKSAWTVTDGGVKFHRVPLYDSPLLIAEKSALQITSPAR